MIEPGDRVCYNSIPAGPTEGWWGTAVSVAYAEKEGHTPVIYDRYPNQVAWAATGCLLVMKG